MVTEEGTAKATVKVQFPPWLDDLRQDIDVELIAGNILLIVSIPADDVHVNRTGNSGRYASQNVVAKVRKYRKNATRVTVRVSGPAVADIVAEALLVRVRMAGQSASNVMSCLTKRPGRREVTNCRVE